MTHVPYRGVPQALTDVVAGHVHVLFADPGSAVPHMRDGKIRALGVTSLTRAPAIPDLVPIAESGVPTFNAVSWQLIVAPAKTSPEIINRLHGTIKSITSQPDIETQFAKLGLIPADSPSPDELRAFVTSEIARWGEIVRRAGVAGSE